VATRNPQPAAPAEPRSEPGLPEGVVTLVFTDIQGSSDLWEQYGAAFKPVLDEHNRLMREAARHWEGREVKTEGDAFFLVFDTASNAVRFTLEAQQAFARADWEALLPGVGSLRVRMGCHSGEPLLGFHPGGLPDYFGPVVNRAARVSGAGHGGQVLLSEATRLLALEELPAGIGFSDLGPHRLKGVGEERLWQLTHPDLSTTFPPLNTLDARRHNLPLASTPYVGRDEELREWIELLLRPETRLLTLAGFGGMGKTRTALQMAELSLERFPDGVWWVDLQEALNGEGVIQRLAYQLRLHLQPQPSPREQVWSYLRDREMLLVLDNTEQIRDGGETVSELLQAARKVKVLLTTRRALELPGETVVEVGPLGAAESERLFEEAARRRKPDFVLTPENAGDVAELCRQLEGVPLAVELAASRVVAMTPREIVRRLDDCFRLLQVRSPVLPPRQRALRGAIDWSYELLTEEDQRLFAELSVFAGGFTMESAEAVSEAEDVFEGVTELRRQSLLRSETSSETQETRYVMLETVRRFAAEKLEDEEVPRRHAAYFLHFAEARAGRIRTRGEADALEALGREWDNLHAALRWALETGSAETAVRLSLAFFPLLQRRGFRAEGRRILEDALQAAVQLGVEGGLEASVRHCLANVLHDMGAYGEAEAEAQKALALRRSLGDPKGAGETLNLLGLLAGDGEEAERAERLLQEALSVLPETDRAHRAMVLHNLARLRLQSGRDEEARALYEETLRHRRAAGDARGEAETLGNLGVLAQNGGRLEEARRLYLESLAVSRALRDRHSVAVLLHNLGEVAELEGALERAAALFFHAEQLFRDTQSAYVLIPGEALRRLSAVLPPERWAEVLDAAHRVSWQELVT